MLSQTKEDATLVSTLEELYPNRIGHFQPGDRVEVFYNGKWEKATVSEPLHYHASDEVSVLCDRKIHNRKLGGGYGLIAGVCSPEIRPLKNEKFDEEFAVGRLVKFYYDDDIGIHAGTICQKNNVPKCRIAILCDDPLPKIKGIRLFAQGHGLTERKEDVEFL